MKFAGLALALVLVVSAVLTAVSANPVADPGFSKGRRRPYYPRPSVIYEVAHPPPVFHYQPQPYYHAPQPIIVVQSGHGGYGYGGGKGYKG